MATTVPELPFPPELFNEILTTCPVDTLFIFASAIPSYHPQIEFELRQRLERLLTCFIPDLPAFQSMLRDTRAVISGSTALSYLTGDSEWMAADLDIYSLQFLRHRSNPLPLRSRLRGSYTRHRDL